MTHRITTAHTAGVWAGNWEIDENLSPLDRTCLTQSDHTSFHCYGKPERLEKVIGWLARFDRPKLCTEYIARTTGLTELRIPDSSVANPESLHYP